MKKSSINRQKAIDNILEAYRQSKKYRGAVPTRKGKPIFEQLVEVDEEVMEVLVALIGLYESNRSMRFREWVSEVVEVLKDLD